MRKFSGWISEITYFYRQQMMRPLSPKAQALWHYLMNRANEVYWNFPMLLSLPEIAAGCHMSDSAAKRARRELIDKYYLACEPQGGSRPSAYTLLSNLRPGYPVMMPSVSEELGEAFDPSMAFSPLATIHWPPPTPPGVQVAADLPTEPLDPQDHAVPPVMQEFEDPTGRRSQDAKPPSHPRYIALRKSEKALRRAGKKKRRRRT